MFTLVFVMIIIVFIVIAIKGIAQWSKNNASPKLSVEASLVSKSRQVSDSHHHDAATGATHINTSTTYNVTFQVQSGDRMVFRVSGHEFNMLAEGDRGMLHFQGTRYLGFDRYR